MTALIVGQFIALPKNPTTLDRITQGAESIIAGVLVVALPVILYAIIVAPYEQRNALRRQLAEARNDFDEMRWGKERRSVYAQYLTAIRPWIYRIRYWEGPYFDKDATTETLREKEGAFDFRAVDDALEEPTAALELIGSKASESVAGSLVAQLLAFEALYLSYGTLTELQGMANECEKRYAKLRAAFRSDLGISNPEPIDDSD